MRDQNRAPDWKNELVATLKELRADVEGKLSAAQ